MRSRVILLLLLAISLSSTSAMGQEDGPLPPLETIAPPPEAAPAPSEEIIIEESVPVQTYWFYEYMDPWEGSFEIGLDGTEGNADTFNMRVGFKAKFEDEIRVNTFDMTYVDKSRDGIQIALNTLIDLRSEWKFQTSPLTFYIHEFIEFDEFKAFDQRISVDSGFGYRFYDTPANKLIARLGGSASREIGGPEDEVVPELVANLEWTYKINSFQKFYVKVDYFPAIEEFSDFRLNAKAEWETVLSADWGLSMKLSVIDRYDSTPGGAKANDINYSLLMLLAF